MKRAKPLTKEMKDAIIAVMVEFDFKQLDKRSARTQYRRGIINELHAMSMLHGVCSTNSKLVHELTVDQFHKCVSEYLNTQTIKEIIEQN